MSKLIDFYKKAATDPDLEAAKKRYEEQNPGKAEEALVCIRTEGDAQWRQASN